jgi:hypothetical protein
MARRRCAVEHPRSRRLAVVQAPMTSSPCSLLFRQDLCTSRASVVTFLSARVLGAAPIKVASVMTPTGAFTRSKMVPRLTANASWRWPTKSRAGWLQPGMFTVCTCWAA